MGEGIWGRTHGSSTCHSPGVRGEHGLFEEDLKELPCRSEGTTEGKARSEGKGGRPDDRGSQAPVRTERTLEAECYSVECVVGP